MTKTKLIMCETNAKTKWAYYVCQLTLSSINYPFAIENNGYVQLITWEFHEKEPGTLDNNRIELTHLMFITHPFSYF